MISIESLRYEGYGSLIIYDRSQFLDPDNHIDREGRELYILSVLIGGP